MKNLTLSLLCLIFTNFAFGSIYKTLQVEEVAKLIDKKVAKVMILDANGAKIRKNFGVIPGAKLLDSASEYKVAEVLPADKTTKLVFYCGGKMCTASHAAAERAAQNGYSDVNVMADGIKGWLKAGKPVTKF
jgi:rhodanese-related sulfurtransferase